MDIRRGDQDSLVFGALKAEIVPAFWMEKGFLSFCFRHIQQDTREVQAFLFFREISPDLQEIGSSHKLINRPHSQRSHDLPQLPRDKAHEILHILRLPGKSLSKRRVLGSDPHGAGIGLADTHHHASHRDQRSGRKAEFLRSQDGRDRNVPAAHELSVGLDHNLVSQPVGHQCLMGFSQTELPWKPRIVDG